MCLLVGSGIGSMHLDSTRWSISSTYLPVLDRAQAHSMLLSYLLTPSTTSARLGMPPDYAESLLRQRPISLQVLLCPKLVLGLRLSASAFTAFTCWTCVSTEKCALIACIPDSTNAGHPGFPCMGGTSIGHRRGCEACNARQH